MVRGTSGGHAAIVSDTRRHMRKKRTTDLERHFVPLRRLPCWDVHWCSQFNLYLNFGAPRLIVRQPRKTTARSRLRPLLSHRLVTVKGQWRLWLFWSRWTLSVRGLPPVRNTGSARRIREALRLLNGQCLTKTVISPADGRTRFEFDLGATLDARTLDRSTNSDIWSLYKPDRRVLSVRGDGSFSLRPGNWDAKYQRIVAPDVQRGVAKRTAVRGRRSWRRGSGQDAVMVF